MMKKVFSRIVVYIGTCIVVLPVAVSVARAEDAGQESDGIVQEGTSSEPARTSERPRVNMQERRDTWRTTRQDGARNRGMDREFSQGGPQAMMNGRGSEWKDNQEQNQADRQAKFCENFSARMDEMKNRLSSSKDAFLETRTRRSEDIGEQRDTRDNELSSTRESQDARRNAWYEKLDAAADTDTKKAAVATFKTTVEAAVDTRRAAVDAAIAAFRKSVDAAIAAKKDARSTGADAFATAVDAAIAQAKSDCTASKDPKTIRSTFQASVQSARTKLQSDRQESAKLGDTVRTLAQTKNTAIQSAMTAFRATMEKAKADLKKAFGEGEVE